MKKVILSISFLSIFCWSFAQQESHYTQFFENTFMYNPAAMGTSDLVDINIGYRKQWTGIAGSPSTVFATVNSPITFNKKEKAISSFNSDDDMWFKTPEPNTGKLKHAVGGKVYNDNRGAFNRTSIFANYAIQVPLNIKTNLSFGIGMGYSNMHFNPDKVTLNNINDQTYNDFLGGGVNRGYFDMEAGLYLYHKNFFVGYSITQIIRNKIYFGDEVTDANLHMHHYLTAGYHWEANKNFTISPMAIAKYMGPAPISFDIALKVDYKKWIWGAVSYRYQDAIGIMAGVNLGKMFQLSYAYDVSIGKIRGNNGGSHEVMLGILIGEQKSKNGEGDEETIE